MRVPGEACGDRVRAALADRPDLLEEYRLQDAHRRWVQARLSWLGRGHERWFETWLEGQQDHYAIRQAWRENNRDKYGRPR